MGKRIQKIPLSNLAVRTLNFGYVGENEHTQIVINCAEIFWDYPDADWSIVVQPPVGDLYNATLSKDGSDLLWDITGSDLVYAGGGQFQLTFSYDGEVIKSIIGSYNINRSLEVSGDAPTPIQNWMEKAEAALNALEHFDDIVCVKESASGNMATFVDGADDYPVKKLEAEIKPVQDLHGYDYSWVGGNGSNLCGLPVPGLSISTSSSTAGEITGEPSDGTSINSATPDYMRIYGGGYITVSFDDTAYEPGATPKTQIHFYDANKTYISNSSGSATNPRTVEVPVLAAYFRVRLYLATGYYQTYNAINKCKLMVNIGQTASDYEPYANVCPISGRTGLTLLRCGRNLAYGAEVQHGNLTSNGGFSADEQYRMASIPNFPVGTYTFSTNLPNAYVTRIQKDGSVTAVSTQGQSYTFTVTRSGYTLKLAFRANPISDITEEPYIVIEPGSEATVENIPVELEQTVYGGKLNLITGELTVNMASVTIDGTETFISPTNQNVTYAQADKIAAFAISDENCKCNLFEVVEASSSSGMTNNTVARQNATNSRLHIKSEVFEYGMTAEQVAAWFTAHPMQYVGWLKEPITYQLDPVEVKSLWGENHIWADSGDVDVTYVADTKLYIDNKFVELAAQIVNS